MTTLTITPSHDGDTDINCHPGEGDKGCFLRAWSHVLCPCETLSLWGQCPPASNSSDLAMGQWTDRNVSLPLGLWWEPLSVCFAHEGSWWPGLQMWWLFAGFSCQIPATSDVPFIPAVAHKWRRRKKRRSPCFKGLVHLEEGWWTAQKAEEMIEMGGPDDYLGLNSQPQALADSVP